MSAVTNDYGQGTSTVYQREQEAKSAATSGKVTHNDFLKLLTKQLTTQDPLNPMQDLDFTAQLAQLQALDEQVAMTKSMQAMRVDSQLQAGTSMIGKYVSGTDDAGAAANGMVKRVVQQDGNVYVELTNAQRVQVSSISNVWNDAKSMFQEIANSGGVIDMWVEAGVDPDTKQPIRGIVEKVQVVNGQVVLQLYGGQKVTWDQVTELRQPTSDEVYYLLPDSVRQKVEKASTMKYTHVNLVDGAGNRHSGIVEGAELDEKTGKVYLKLYGKDETVDFDYLQENTETDNDPRTPTAKEIKDGMGGYWCVGVNGDGKQVQGVIEGVREYEDGIALVLHTGEEVYWDAKSNIRAASDEEWKKYEEYEKPDSGDGTGETEETP